MFGIAGLETIIFAHLQRAEEERDRVYEPVIGIVTSNKDPDHLGRVKVKFPTLSMDDASAWAPLISAGAGKGRGWFFLPEVDDEVLVVFEHGDIARPLVIGALWGGKDKPPEKNDDGKNKVRGLVSRDGSTILFDDDAGTITIADGGGAGVLTIDKQNKITLEAKTGDVILHCKDDLTIVAKEIEMTATTQMEISSATADVKGGSDANVVIKAAAMMQITGATVSINGGSASAPSMPQATPQEVPMDVGSGGGGAAGGAAGAANPGSSQGAPASSPPAAGETEQAAEDDSQTNEPIPADDPHEIEVQVVNAVGTPQPNVYYELVLPDGSKKTGTSGSDGWIRISGLTQQGDCQLTFPDVDEPPGDPKEGEPPP